MPALAAPAITIRPAYLDDVAALRRLAALDSTTVPGEPLLVAEIDGVLRVAVSRADLRTIADPFFPTAAVVDLVKEHIRRGAVQPSRRRRLLARLTLRPSPHPA